MQYFVIESNNDNNLAADYFVIESNNIIGRTPFWGSRQPVSSPPLPRVASCLAAENGK